MRPPSLLARLRVPPRALAVIAILLALPAAPTWGEKLPWDAWRALERRFADALEQPDGFEVAMAAAAEMVADGEPRAFKALCAALREAVEREEKALARAQKLAAGIVKDRWSKEVHEKLSAERIAAASARRLADGIADQIGEGPLALHDVFAETAGKVRARRWHGLLARVYAHTPKRHEAIVWMHEAARDEDPAVRALVLQGLAPHANDWPELVGQRVDDKNWAIQVLAARLARKHGIRAAIGGMIGHLSCAPPRVQLQFVSSLEHLTGNKGWGIDPTRWSFWWEQNRGRFGPQTSSGTGSTCPRREYATFYDLEIQSDRLLLVVDVSASMTQPAIQSFAIDGTAVRGEFRRMDLVRNQLHRTIDKLPRGVRFNMVAFGGKVRFWSKDLVGVDAKMRKRAHDWVDRLQPDGGTYMNGALHAVFGALGFADCTRGPMQADTIVLLSDGAPTDGWPSGRGNKGRAVVLEALRDWNRDGLMVIHTVALRGAAEAFLESLATENGGHTTVR